MQAENDFTLAFIQVMNAQSVNVVETEILANP